MAIQRSVPDPTGDSCYDVVPAQGQTIHVDRGETFENTVIDLSSGDSVFLRVTGANSVVRNVGFTGLYRGDQFLLTIDAGPGEVLVENVYMGDGATRNGRSASRGPPRSADHRPERSSMHGPGAVYLHHGNEAAVTFRRCNVQGFPNNGFHCSNTASGSGSVHFDRCFGKNNGVATFRCGGGEDLIDGCVAYTDRTDYGHDDDGYLETNGRPVWVWHGGTVTIRDTHFADGPYPNAIVAGANDAPGRINFESGGHRGPIHCASGSTVDVGPEVSTEPDLSIPDGVPTTAVAAASGGMIRPSSGASSDASDRFPHAIVFDARAVSDPTSYAFEATGDVATARHGAPIGHVDIVHGQPVSGTVTDDLHVYWFEGDVEVLSLRGDASVNVQYDGRDPSEPGGPFQS